MNVLKRLVMVSIMGVSTQIRADHYVAQAGQTPSGSYTSWSSAASNIQAAVNAAAAGATVWVGAGVYTGASQVVSINKALILKAAATNTDVIIDGKGVARGIKVGLSSSSEVVIDGFTISNCYQLNDYGGGIYITNAVASTSIVQNCILVSNRVMLTAAPAGGGLAVRVPVGVNFLAAVSNCSVVGNYAGTGGGGLYFENARFLVEHSRIANNWVDQWDPFATPPVMVANNRGGGGVSIVSAGEGSVIRNCTIESNRVSRWGGGLAIRYDSGVLVADCTIRGNMAPVGAGIMTGGNSGSRTSIIRNCLIAGNLAVTNNGTSAGYGGGVRLGDSVYGFGRGTNEVLESCTIVSNFAHSQGGGVFIDSTSAGDVVLNSIVYGNQAGNHANIAGTAAWTNSLTTPSIYVSSPSTITNQSPAFADAAAGDYRLTRSSPCVNTGTNQPWMVGALDLMGRPRLDGGNLLVDMGAYEFVFPSGSLIVIR